MSSNSQLRTVGLTKHYNGFTAVDSLSLEVQKGEIFGFLGPNGAGKSTSLNMICGLLKPSAGEVYIDNKKASGSANYRSKIGLCPQENIFWTRLTCLEQLEFAGEMYGIKRNSARTSAITLLEKMGLGEKRNHLAQTLSGGMKRRLNICLALIHDPEILVLDEPETGLDPQSRVMVREHIRTLAAEKTVILTTHNMDEAERLAHRVAIIDHGKLLMLDTVEALKHSIGGGDIIEMSIYPSGESSLTTALERITRLEGKMKYAAPLLTFQSYDVIVMAGIIADILKSNRLHYSDIHMRETTLEDVFIHLTGRKLRE